MLRVLVAAADPAEAAALQDGFGVGLAGQVELELVGGALYALTSLERRRADLVVSAARLDDMTGHDLFDLVCDDEALRQVPFVLLTDAFDAVVPLPHHALLGARAGPAEVFAAAVALLVAAGRLAEVPTPGPVGAGDAKLSGTFEVLSLFDLVSSLAHGRKSGRLVLSVGGAEGVLHLDAGSLVHAHLGRANGEEAVMAAFAALERDPTARFTFLGADDPGGGLVTIQTPVDKLLLQAAVALDEQKRVSV